MKKFLTSALVLTMILSLAACGEKTPAQTESTTPAPSGNGTSATSQQVADNTTSGNDSENTADLTTVSGFLTEFGLTENDMKCANFTRLDRTSYVLDTMKITEVGSYVSEKLTDDDVKAWLEQIIGKLNSLSGNGKIENSHADAQGEALTAEFIMNRTMKIGGGSYDYNGKTVDVVISVSPGALDNEDPDEAMPACSLELIWRN